jgi:1,4-dihydroxy-2-naphthoate octaprenyltransferase
MRFMSISNQSRELLIRSRLVRNAILSMQLSIALFVLTSVTVGISLFISTDIAKTVPLVVFIIGMVSVLAGILFAAGEVHRSYKIILLEVKAE